MTLWISQRHLEDGPTGGSEPQGWLAEPDDDVARDDGHAVRREALDAIRRVCTAADEQVLLVVGPEGSGKSYLLGRAAADPRLGAELMRVSAAEARWSTSGLSYLLTLWPSDTAETLLHHLNGRPEDDAFAVASQMVLSLRGLVGGQVLLIDDLDQMDPTSLTVVAIILRRLRGTGLRVIASLSSLSAESPLTGLPAMTLPPLDARQSFEVARAHSGGRHPDHLLERAADFGGGSAAGVVEALAGQARDPAEAAWRPPCLGDVSARAVDRRLAGLSADAIDVLRSLSLAQSTPKDLSVLPSRAIDDLLQAGEVQETSGLLTFRDPRLRAVLYWWMSPADRASRHESLAEAALATHHPTAVWHSGFAGRQDPADLVRAARQWVAEGATSSAVDLVERAVAADWLGDETASPLMEVAEAICGLEAHGQATRMAELAARGSFDPTVQLRSMIVRVRGGSMVHPKVFDALATAVVQAPNPVDPDAVARLLHVVCFYDCEMGDGNRARSWWKHVDRVIDDCAPSTRARHAVLGDYLGVRPSERSREHLVVGSAPVASEQTDLLIAARGQSNGERYSQARGVLDALSGLDSLVPVVRASLPTFALENECRAGDFGRAREAARQVVAVDQPRETLDAFRASALAVYWTLTGRPDLAREHVDLVLDLPSRFSGSPLQAKVYGALGRARLDEGEVEEAHRMLTHADRAAQHIDDPLVVRHEGDLIEAMVGVGDVDAANAALVRLQGRLRAHPSRWGALVLSRSQALVLDESPRVAALRCVIAAWPPESDAASYGYEYGRTQAILAQRLEELGDHADARDHWARAVRSMDGVGLRARARSIRAKRLGDRAAPAPLAAPLSRLSDREREVVSLVLAGARNREIARDLYVSLRTVESRLTASYRKLGVRSRAELMATYLGTPARPGTSS